MKTPTLCCLVLAGMIMLPSSAFSASYGDIYVSLVDGDVLMNTEDTQDWVPAAGNTPLGESDRIWVADAGRSELKLRHGTVIRLNSRTALEVLAVEAGGVQFSVDAGEVYVRVEEPNSDTVAIETPAATISPDQTSSFRIDVQETGEVSLSVTNGIVRVDRPYGDLQVVAGQRLVFRQEWDRPRLAALKSSDGFDDWNRRRDHEQFDARASASRQYLPEELRGYAADFDHNGRWVETPDHGFVWMPTMVASAGWSPYRSGRWVWMRGDYVWISYEPWGWAPHHYGRWAFVRPFGWCWVPPTRRQVHWGPGYVGWVHSSAAVSWVPLAPREIYYGHGPHGPYSVDVGSLPRQVPPNQNVNLYRNVRVANAVTTVHRDTFLTGKTTILKARPNLFLERRTVYAPPSIKPVKATTMPQIGEVRRSERPPAHLFRERRKGNEKAHPISSAPPAISKPTPNITAPPDRPGSRDASSWRKEDKTLHGTVPASAPRQPAKTIQPKERPVKAGSGPAKEPVSADDKANRPISNVSKAPLPPQTSQTSRGPHVRKDPGQPSVNREDVHTAKDESVAKQTPAGLNAPATINQKKLLGSPPKTAPALKPSTASAPASQTPQAKSHKPPAAPAVSNKSDIDKHGKEASEGKNRKQHIKKDGTPEKEGYSGKEPRQETRESR